MDKNIIVGNNFPIQPCQINTHWRLIGAFENSETDMSAHYILKLCQRLGGWFPFSLKQIEEIFNESAYKRFPFNLLVEPGEILTKPDPTGKTLPRKEMTGGGYIIYKDEKYHLTDEFVTRCYEAFLRQEKEEMKKKKK